LNYIAGDGAGVGKGRTIAAIIYENFLQGRKKSIWMSVSPDLSDVAQKDLNDIGANINVHSMKHMTTGKKFKVGVLFCTYACLVYNAEGKTNRLNQVVEWFEKDYDGVVFNF